MNLNQIKKQRKGKTPWRELGVHSKTLKMWVSYGYMKPDLSLPAKVYQAKRYLYPHESEQEAMRGDWEKIGADFRVSIAKAEREAAAK